METFIRTIVHVSDEEYQDRVWIEGRGPECDDFGEFVNYFLDESEAILEKYKDFAISDAQYPLLKKFEDEVRIFAIEMDRSYLPQVFLKSSEWKKIMEMAKEILKAFNYQKKI
ncbi:MAG: hypothetical protein K1000chlam3_00771 [Chlamydiae bacterium]|nr:hypothetical protein [Chlamydiota bacterium]